MIKKPIFFLILMIIILAIIGGLFIFNQLNQSTDQAADLTPVQLLVAHRSDYLLLGISEASLDKIIEQILLIEEQIKVGQADYLSVVQLGVLYQRLHEYDLAKKNFEVAIEILPGEGIAYGNLAELYVFDYKDFAKAEENYKKAIEYDYYRMDYYRSLSDLYRSEFPDKVSSIEQLMLDGAEKNPDDKNDFYTYLIDFFWQQDDLNKAIQYTQKVLDSDPNNSKYQETLQTLQAKLSSR